MVETGYVLYTRMTPEQSAVVVAMHPDWQPMEFYRFEFWVNKNEQASRKKGHHRLSERAAAAIDRTLTTSSETSAPTVTRDMPRRYTGSPPMHLGSNKD